MIYAIDAIRGGIGLGHYDETGVCRIQFDVTAWRALYPDTGVFSLTYQRPTESVVYDADAGDLVESTVGLVKLLTWTVRDTVTAIAGTVAVVVRLKEGSAIKKYSDVIHGIVLEGLPVGGVAPEPLASYIAQWATADITLTWLDLGETPTAAITQDAQGTHIALSVPAGPVMSVNPITGELEATI